MIKEVIPKSQYIGEFRRCFIDDDTGRDMIVWFESGEMLNLLSVQFEDKECRILKLNFTKDGNTFWHSYERDVSSRMEKDFLVEVPLENEVAQMNGFADFFESVPDLRNRILPAIESRKLRSNREQARSRRETEGKA